MIKTLHHMQFSSQVHVKERFDTVILEEFGEDRTLADVRYEETAHILAKRTLHALASSTYENCLLASGASFDELKHPARGGLLPFTVRQAYDVGPIGFDKALDEGDISLVRKQILALYMTIL